MPDDIILQLRGRISEPSHSVAPAGALLRADNCVMRKPAILSPIPDAIETDVPALVTLPLSISPEFDNGTDPAQLLCGAVLTLSYPDGTTITPYSPRSGDVRLTYATVPNSNDPIPHPFHVTRGNLYGCDGAGAYKWTSTDETQVIRLLGGLWGGLVAFDVATPGGGNGPIDPANHTQYAAVVRLKDANGVITRWAPTPAIDYPGSATDYAQLIILGLGDVYGHPSFDAIEIYRARQLPLAITLPNEMYYVGETIGPPTLLGSVLVFTFDDLIPDDQLGASLYTSTSQGGTEATNIAPPEHLYHASFRGHEFWGDVTGPDLFTLRVGPLPLVTDASVSFSGDTTVGSNVITNVTGAISDLKPGVVLSQNPGYIIESVDVPGLTVTVTEDFTANAAGVAFSVTDTMHILYGDATTDVFPINAAIAATHLPAFTYPLQITPTDPAVNLAQDWVLASNRRVGRRGVAQAWIVNVTGRSYDPEYPEPTTFDANMHPTAPAGLESEPSNVRRRLMWSKLQEPEHTTLLNFADVGSTGRIVGLGALKDALIVLKDDGAYRLTGDNGNWRIDPIDTSVKLIGGRTTQTMDNAVFALGDRGVMRMTSTTVENLSDGVVDDWFYEYGYFTGKPRIESIREMLLRTDGYTALSTFAVGESHHREYMLFCESDALWPNGVPNKPVSTAALLYNSKTGAFTTYSYPNNNRLFRFTCGVALGGLMTRGTSPSAPGSLRAPCIQICNTDTAPDVCTVHLFDNRVESLADPQVSQQDIALRALHVGDPTHLKIWTSLIWDTDGEDTLPKTAVFQDGETKAVEEQAIDQVDGEEVRVWMSRDVVRSTKMVVGLRGQAITLYAARLTYASSGRESPLSAFGVSP